MSASSQELCTITFESAEVGLAILDPDACIVMWNGWLAKRSGIPAEDALGKRLEDLFPDLEGSRLQRMVLSTLRHGTTGVLRPAFGSSPLPLTVSRMAARGFERIQQSVAIKPLDVDPRHCLLQVFDVTSMIHREQLLRDQAKRLQRSNEELKELAYVVSHDLRAPLRTVQQFAGFLVEDCDGRLSEESLSHLDRITHRIRRMDQLIVDLLEYSKVGFDGGEQEPVDLTALVSDIVESLAASIDEAQGRVEVDELPVVIGDPVRLTQLFQNLISNALKFQADDSPVVQVSCTKQEDRYEIRVADNGIGINPAHQDRIFGVFKRLHAESEYEGTGIGLAVCMKIALLHGGPLEVESEPGKGSTFIFTLAAAPQAT
ncbi:MAG: PAS domain-containing protein [bacterium]|nr:PAS domain-containing protein [bacterium]